MSERVESESRKLLGRLRDIMAVEAAGQARLDRITHLTADSMDSEVCSVYLFRDEDTLELCATEGLNKAAVHQTRMRLGEGLVGRVARTGHIINTPDAPSETGFRYMPETGEEIYNSLHMDALIFPAVLGAVLLMFKKLKYIYFKFLIYIYFTFF